MLDSGRCQHWHLIGIIVLPFKDYGDGIEFFLNDLVIFRLTTRKERMISLEMF